MIFSADAHIVEPSDLWKAQLPPSLKERRLKIETNDDGSAIIGDGQVLSRTIKLRRDADRRSAQGARDLCKRRDDLRAEGIDGQLLFPSLAFYAYAMKDHKVANATIAVYNEWVKDAVLGYPEFIASAMLSATNAEDTLASLEGAIADDFRLAILPMRPCEMFAEPAFDAVWRAAAEAELALVFHAGTGVLDPRGTDSAQLLRGAAVRTMDAIDLVSLLVDRGVFDRFPSTRLIIAEAGATWLPALAERLDEAADVVARPSGRTFQTKPSDQIKQNVRVTFSRERACVALAESFGHECFIWADDYPHIEGTFPFSQRTIESTFEGLCVSTEARKAMLGEGILSFLGTDAHVLLACSNQTSGS